MNATYIVVSDNCTVGTRGTTVTGEQLDGCNVAALIEGGHLITPPPDKTKSEAPAAIPATETKEQ